MISKAILRGIAKVKQGEKFECNIAFRDVEKDPLFLEEYDTGTLESLIFKLDGHKAITDFRFSEEKFMKWCKEQNIECISDPMFREYRLSFKFSPAKVGDIISF